jgi:prepilin-type N-terminal cleavage/methylation domain-containing protein
LVKNFNILVQSQLKFFIFKNILSNNKRAFTLVELIIVIAIVGILASLGLTQYGKLVEKFRTTEAKVRIETMRNLVYSYYLENGSITSLQPADVGAVGTCSDTDYYTYYFWLDDDHVGLVASRCGSGGKTPNASRTYYLTLLYYPGTGQSTWYCNYTGGMTPCFGLPAY